MFHLTQTGIDELKAEHANLVSQRGGVADRIRQARELGDLSENAEYQTAREEQDRLEARISEVDHCLPEAAIQGAGRAAKTGPSEKGWDAA